MEVTEAIRRFKQSRSFCDDPTKNHYLDRLKSSEAQNLRITHNNFKERRAGSLQRQIEINDTVKTA